MADTGTCGECEHWGCGRGELDGILTKTRRGVVDVEAHRCMAHDGEQPYMAHIWTPADATCPAFRRRVDAAERAAQRLRAEVSKPEFLGLSLDTFYDRVAQIIREEYAKDKEAR